MSAKNQNLLRGNTLRVYLYLLKQGCSRLREVQRELQLSTASLASYHLTRLVEAGYVEQKQDGSYCVVKDASPDLLAGYMRFGGAVVPQMFFFSLFFSIVLGFFGAEAFRSSLYAAELAIASIGAVAVMWYETIRLWSRLVTWK